MNLAETADLVVNLKMNDAQFKRGVADAQTSLKKVGGLAVQGAKTAAQNIAKIGAVGLGVGVVALTGAVKSGLESLATLEDATSSVDGAIKQLGLTGKVTAQQIAGWANDIESDVGAAFDDKDILQATTTLIRFGHIVPENIKPAMVVMTDLAAKTGDVGSASDLLSKALANPAEAAGKLARVGVILTDQQKEQIKAMTEAGDVAGAQSLLLDALAESTKGAAAASQGPYRTAINTLKDTWEDVTRALAVGFLPVIQEVASYLKGKLADPGFLDKVKEFGQTLAGFLQDALDAAKKIPWDSIANAMKLAGAGAKAAYDLFMGLPDWVKTAVLTGWGLNKLTGGALGGIVGELSKGLIKGVLGMTAAVVNINAATANLGGAGATSAIQAEAAATGSGMVGALKTALAAAFTVSTAYLIFKPVADTIGTLIGGALGTKPTAPNTPGSLLLSGTPFGGGFDIGEYRKAHGLDPQTGLPVMGGAGGATGGPAAKGPTTVVPGPGFTEYMHGMSQQTGEQKDELSRIHALAGQLPLMTGELGTIAQQQAAQGNKFVAKWDELQGAVTRAGAESRREIAKGLGVTVKELINLRHVARNEIAREIGISTQEFIRARRQAHGDDTKLAAKLGISVEELQAIRDKARLTAANTQAIKNKDFSPTIKVTSNFNVSARTVVAATRIYRTQAGRNGVAVE